MPLLSPLARVALRTSAPCRTCVRPFASSSSRSDTPSIFKDLLEGEKAKLSESSQRYASPREIAQNRRAAQGNIHDMLGKEIGQVGEARRRRESSQENQDDIAAKQERSYYERQMTRRWNQGDVYAPHDISGVEMSKWKQTQRKGRPQKDVFDMLRINPLHHYKNFALMSEFMTEMGKIKHSNDTGLRPVNQRKMARALRRAIGLGLMPSVHQHPEILNKRRRL